MDNRDIDSLMEPDSLRNIELSQAISLKRIADALDKLITPPTTILMSAEEYKKYIDAKDAYAAGIGAMKKSATPTTPAL